jgi:hypothetical protein
MTVLCVVSLCSDSDMCGSLCSDSAVHFCLLFMFFSPNLRSVTELSPPRRTI